MSKKSRKGTQFSTGGQASTPEESSPAAPALTPTGFDYRKLALSSPLAEFEAYGKQKIKTSQRLGEQAEVDLLLEAFELGRDLLKGKPEAGS